MPHLIKQIKNKEFVLHFTAILMMQLLKLNEMLIDKLRKMKILWLNLWGNERFKWSIYT